MPIIHDNADNRVIRRNQSNPLYLAAGWLADKRISKKKEQQTSDLVATLLSHGARSWRMSQPKTSIHLHSINPNGFAAVRLHIK